MGIIENLKMLQEKKHPEEKLPVSQEVAEEQIYEFISYYNIDINQMEDAESTYEAISMEIRHGRLSIETSEGYPVIKQIREGADDIVYKKITHELVKVKNKYTIDDDKILAILGKLSGLGYDLMTKLEGADRMTAFRAGALFLPAV